MLESLNFGILANGVTAPAQSTILGVVKGSLRRHYQVAKTDEDSTPPRKLSRELAGLKAWSGWKGSDSETSSDDEMENEGGGTDEGEKAEEKEEEKADEGGDEEEEEKRPAAKKHMLNGAKSKPNQKPSAISSRQRKPVRVRALAKPKRAENQLNVTSEAVHPLPQQVNVDPRIVGNFIFENAEDAELAVLLKIDLERSIRYREGREVADDAIIVASQWESNDDTIVVASQTGEDNSTRAHNAVSAAAKPKTSSQDEAAMLGPKCPLCLCPVHGVYFPVIQCPDCDRTYHMRCIGYRRNLIYHPYTISSIPSAERCYGCGCPPGDVLDVYAGHPSVWHHVREYDPDFREYFRQGRLEEAKYEDCT